MHVLCFLAENALRTVSRDEIFRHVWPDTAVSDEVLTVAISTIRRALDDDARSPRFIRTLTKRGYKCLVRPVALPGIEASGLPSPLPHGTASLTGSPRQLPQPPAAPHGGPASSDGKRSGKRRVRVLGALTISALLALGVFLARAGREEPERPGRVRSIAVLPLAYYSSDETRRYVADGLTEELTTSLAKIEGLEVASRGSAVLSARSSPPKPLSEMARELGVEALLEGAIQVEQDRFRLHVQLIDAVTEHHLWAEDYDRPLADLLDTQAELAADVARAISGRATSVATRPLADPEAYDLYLKARYFRNLETDGGLAEGAAILERVVARSPRFASAHAALAETLLLQIERGGLSAAAGFGRVKVAADRALALDPDLASAHLARAAVAFSADWDFGLAERSFLRSLERDPDDLLSLKWYARFLTAMGRHERALSVSRRIQELDPESYVNLAYVQSLGFAGHYDEALARLGELAAIIPEQRAVRAAYAHVYSQMGLHEEAVEAFLDFLKATGLPEPALQELTATHRRDGPLAVYRALGSEESLIPSTVVKAKLQAILGNYDEAFALLQRAVEARDMNVLWVRVDRSFAPLWPTPRFRELAANIGLPEVPVG